MRRPWIQRTTATSVSGVGVARVSVAMGAANRAPLIEPQKVLPHLTGLRAILAVTSPALVLRRRPLARVVAEPPALPRRQIAVDGVARHRGQHLHVRHCTSEKGVHKHRWTHQSRHVPDFLAKFTSVPHLHTGCAATPWYDVSETAMHEGDARMHT
jgi:hypothetical protein